MTKKRKFWGWGDEDFALAPAFVQQIKQMLQFSLGIKEFQEIPVPSIEDVGLSAPRFALPKEFEAIATHDTFERASHSFGQAFRDVWRALHLQFHNAPDYVAYPKTEDDILALMQFAGEQGVALIPFGGGSSVVGGVEPPRAAGFAGSISVDMQHFNQVLEVDAASRSARIQGGIFGPDLERQLKPYGVTLRHYPQSFEFSTLGGWIATRAGGHFATLYTHIDDFVQSVRMVTPKGVMQTRRLPSSGAGPSEERLVLGSEGTLGIITEAWMRLQSIPQYKLAQTVRFAQFEQAVAAVREISQAGLYPSNARLVDPFEALGNGLGDGKSTVVILGFESHHHSVAPWMHEALQICDKYEGKWKAKTEAQKSTRDAKADTWKNSFLQAPYLRDELIRLGLVVETFETAIPWDKFADFHKRLKAKALEAIKTHCGQGTITCRFTHIYPDGPAPYYTVIAKGTQGRQLEQWDAIKAAVSQVLMDEGATITHHHAVGKDHQPFYAQQHSPLFGEMLRSIKATVDPKGILNPEVLLSLGH
ncbi:MAG TPA: FAD-binding oxidoreductase [Microscillaceae bacterium]|nr:FAD-binding oxidoreductase [Microscillaceae bacterium]